MGIVHLEILEPLNGQRVAGSAPVRFRGRVLSSGHPPLFYKWYSSLHAPTDVTQVAMNTPADDPFDFSRTPGVGSHVVTFAAKDVAGDAPADLKAVVHAGMAGGPVVAEHPCIFHVFLSRIATPEASGAILSKASSTLEAIAPVKWGRLIGSTGNYEPDPDYHGVNRLTFRWRFQPDGAPSGRHAADLVPSQAQLTFVLVDSEPRLRYQGPLPALLDTGNYLLTLRVEDREDLLFGHETTKAVIIAP